MFTLSRGMLIKRYLTIKLLNIMYPEKTYCTEVI